MRFPTSNGRQSRPRGKRTNGSGKVALASSGCAPLGFCVRMTEGCFPRRSVPKTPFLPPGMRRVWHRDCVKEIGVHQMMEELVNSKIALHVAYSVDDRWPPAQPLRARTPHHRPETGASLIVVLLLSLGLWAAIWGTVASLGSAVLR